MDSQLSKLLQIIKDESSLSDTVKSNLEITIKELDKQLQMDSFKLNRLESDKKVINCGLLAKQPLCKLKPTKMYKIGLLHLQMCC